MLEKFYLFSRLTNSNMDYAEFIKFLDIMCYMQEKILVRVILFSLHYSD